MGRRLRLLGSLALIGNGRDAIDRRVGGPKAPTGSLLG